MKPLLRILAFAAVVAWSLALAGPARAQDPAKALGNLLRQLTPPAVPAAPAPTAAPSRLDAAGEVLQLLIDSVGAIDEPREVEVGRQLAAVLLGSKPLDPDLALQRYVNRLGRWISLQSPRPQLPWTFAVLDDPGFNAFAAPGGYVFVTRGLVERVDEAELAGILAHEIAHVTHKHHLQALAVKARSGLAARFIASQLRNEKDSTVSAQVMSLGRDLYARGLDRTDEFEADREGVALAARAGFDPYGLPAVLQQLRAAPADHPLFALTLATHPPAQQRLELLETAMGTRLDALSGKPAVPISGRVRDR